jgi:DNA-binding response OmpR family regulator
LYYQADNAQIKGINGTGVGLYLVKTYTELHEGNVTFNSKLDSGSTFIVEIPVREKSTHLKIGDAEIRNTDKLNQFRFTTESNKVKILIVEDNVDIMFFLKNELEDFFTIYSAKNGVEAIKILNSVKPDLILSDVMMPQMDGYELCKKIKNNISTCHIPIIMLTAKISHESQMEGYAAGANDYLTKPFNSEILIAKIQRILELRKQIQLKILNKPDTIPGELRKSNSAETQFLENLFKILEKNLDNITMDVEFLA